MLYLWSVNCRIYLKYVEALELDVFALASEHGHHELEVVWGGDVARHGGDLTTATQQLQY